MPFENVFNYGNVSCSPPHSIILSTSRLNRRPSLSLHARICTSEDADPFLLRARNRKINRSFHRGLRLCLPRRQRSDDAIADIDPRKCSSLTTMLQGGQHEQGEPSTFATPEPTPPSLLGYLRVKVSECWGVEFRGSLLS